MRTTMLVALLGASLSTYAGDQLPLTVGPQPSPASLGSLPENHGTPPKELMMLKELGMDAVALSARFCFYEDKRFSHGALLKQDGKRMKCETTTWTGTWVPDG